MTVTTIEDKQFQAKDAEFKDGKLTVKSDPPQSVAMDELQRVAFKHETTMALEWVGQKDRDLVQIGAATIHNQDVLELYDQREHKVYYWSKLDHKKKGKRQDQFEFAIDPFAQDSLSAFFYVRSLPLEILYCLSMPRLCRKVQMHLKN